MKLIELVKRYGGEEVITKFTVNPLSGEGESLREQNFENLVLFYEEELKEIENGKRAFDVLSRYKVKMLVKKGILTMDYPKYGGRRHILSMKTRNILEKIRYKREEDLFL